MSDIFQDLEWRYATKQFNAAKKVPEDQFQKLLDALVLTPSSYGLQPWKFVVVESSQLRKQLQSVSWNQSQVVDASHLIVFCALQKIDAEYVDHYVKTVAQQRSQSSSGEDSDQLHQALSALESYKSLMIQNVVEGMSEQQQKIWMEKQIYIALGNLMTVAASMHIDTCPMEGFEAAKYDEILGLSEKGLRSVVVCPVGYRSQEDKYAEYVKVRFPKEEIVVRIS